MKIYRRLVQILSFLALNAGAWLQLKWLCPQIMWCHACPASVVACPIGVLGYFISMAVFPVFLLGLFLVVAAVAGRFLCGWVCPFGLVQDILYRIPGRKRNLPRWTSLVKYPVFLVMVVGVAASLGLHSILYYCRTCPVASLSSVIPRAIQSGSIDLDSVTVFRLVFLTFVLLMSVPFSRFFCRVLCPVAAVVAPLNELAAFTVTMDDRTCNDCGACRRNCTMGLDPTRLRGSAKSDALTRTECVNCTECTAKCRQGSLAVKG